MKNRTILERGIYLTRSELINLLASILGGQWSWYFLCFVLLLHTYSYFYFCNIKDCSYKRYDEYKRSLHWNIIYKYTFDAKECVIQLIVFSVVFCCVVLCCFFLFKYNSFTPTFHKFMTVCKWKSFYFLSVSIYIVYIRKSLCNKINAHIHFSFKKSLSLKRSNNSQLH